MIMCCALSMKASADDMVAGGPEIESGPDATALWNQTGFHRHCPGTHGTRRAFSIILGGLQRELCRAYGAENARKVLQAIVDTME